MSFLETEYSLSFKLPAIVGLYSLYRYIPGWDCHGLPVENKALKDLGVCRFLLPLKTSAHVIKNGFKVTHAIQHLFGCPENCSARD